MSRFLIGIDVGGTNIKIMIMTDTYEVVAKTSIPTHAELGYEKISDNMIEAIDKIFEEKKIKSPDVVSIAMGLPGTIDKKAEKTVYLSVLRWNGFNPCEKLGKYYKAKTSIDNDANINALGEYAFGKNGKRENLVLITLGTGVGCGVVSEGRIFGGAANMAAELGHMIIEADGGALCLCGRRGHLEAYCSGTALKRDALEMAKTHPETILHKYIEEAGGDYDNSMVTRGAGKGDSVCLEIMERFTHYLAAGIANVMTLYNPDLILIGGGISNAGNMLIKPLNEKCRKMVIHERSYCPVARATLGSEAGMYGACALAGQSVGM